MGTVPTGQMERELKKLYLNWVKGIPSHEARLDEYIDVFGKKSSRLIERMGGHAASLGALAGFPAPKLLELSPVAGLIYDEMKQTAIQAAISIGLNAKDTARAMLQGGLDKSYRRLERLARTETVRAYWKNSWDSVEGLGLVMLWSAEAGPRTCDYCLSREGLVVEDRNVRDHPNGRCTLLPTLASRVKYKGTLQPDGSVDMDPKWDKKQELKAPTPAETWVEQYKATHPSLSDEDLRNLDAIARGDQYAAKRMLNAVNGTKLTQAEANQAIRAIKGQTPKTVKIAPKPKAVKIPPKPVAAPAPTEPMSRIFRGVTKNSEDAVARYTQDSFQMNAALRSGLVPEGADLIDAAIKGSSLPRATKVLRVVDDKAGSSVLRVARSKGTYSDEAFLSTQKKGFWDVDELIENFAMSGGKPVVIEFDLPPGYSALDISGKLDNHPLALGFNQGEVLLARRAAFKASLPVDKGDYWLVRMRPV